jgi:hypothetical protein
VSPEISFKTMEEFYEVLRGVGLNESQINKIRDVFEYQEIIPTIISSLNDEKLKRLE